MRKSFSEEMRAPLGVTACHYVKLGLGDRTEIEFFDGPRSKLTARALSNSYGSICRNLPSRTCGPEKAEPT